MSTTKLHCLITRTTSMYGVDSSSRAGLSGRQSEWPTIRPQSAGGARDKPASPDSTSSSPGRGDPVCFSRHRVLIATNASADIPARRLPRRSCSGEGRLHET
jgi:hypothetical protein